MCIYYEESPQTSKVQKRFFRIICLEKTQQTIFINLYQSLYALNNQLAYTTKLF